MSLLNRMGTTSEFQDVDPGYITEASMEQLQSPGYECISLTNIWWEQYPRVGEYRDGP